MKAELAGRNVLAIFVVQGKQPTITRLTAARFVNMYQIVLAFLHSLTKDFTVESEALHNLGEKCETEGGVTSTELSYLYKGKPAGKIYFQMADTIEEMLIIPD